MLCLMVRERRAEGSAYGQSYILESGPPILCSVDHAWTPDRRPRTYVGGSDIAKMVIKRCVRLNAEAR